MAKPTATIRARQAFADAYAIDLAGELTLLAEPALLNAYEQATSKGARLVILNFKQLAYKSSSGLTMLVALLARCNSAGQCLFAVELSVEYRKIFQVTGLDQGITLYASEAEALQAAHDLLDAQGMQPPASASGVAPAQPAIAKRSMESWAKPVEQLDLGEIPAGASALNVHGRRLFGPLQGFGQLWQKTYRIGLQNTKLTPRQVMDTWKHNVPRLKPQENRFFPSAGGISPNELVLIDAQTPGGPISTGVMVLYASDTSFALMTPAGHPEAGWITFSSFVEEGRTFAQVQVIARASDPLYEVAFRLAGSKLQDQIWIHVLTALATKLGTSGTVKIQRTLFDPKLQWARASNIWYNAFLRTLLYTPVALVRRIAARVRWNNRRVPGPPEA